MRSLELISVTLCEGAVDDQVDMPITMRRGITLHRKIDSFTDQHPEWRRSGGRLAPERRRLAGIIIDVLYDHYLCVHWEKYSEQSLNEFAEFCCGCLLSRTQFMESEARRVVRRMQQHDWLNSYQTVRGIEFAFKGLSKRAPALAEIHLAKADFRDHYDELESDFLAFYPELQIFAKDTWTDLNL